MPRPKKTDQQKIAETLIVAGKTLIEAANLMRFGETPAKKPAAKRKARSPIVEVSATPADPAYDWERSRHRGWLNHFIRLGGKEWKGPGPSPLEPGCTIRADVMKEFKDQLKVVKIELARPKEPEPA